MYVPLKPLKEAKKKENVRFGIVDIEARDWDKLVLVGFFDGDLYRDFLNVDDFLIYIFSAESVPSTIYAHFGGKYDFLFLIATIIEYPNLEITDMIPRGSGILSFKLSDGERSITFADSAAFLPFSLKSLCENFKVEHNKLDWDHSKTAGYSKELSTYCEYDCKGLYEVIEKYRTWPLIERAGAKSTMASQALQVLRLFLKEPIQSLSDEVDEFVRGAYFGGRTEIFIPLFDGHKLADSSIFCFDVNSLYPTVMQANDFPNRFAYFTDKYEPGKMGFYEVKVKVPKSIKIPPLGTVLNVNGTDKFIFPTGIFRGRWSSIELEYAKTLGVKVLKVYEGIIFRNGGPIFKDYIDELYAIRKRSDKYSVDNLLTKLLMNSCYGRFGLNKDRENLVFDNGQDDIEIYCELKTKKGMVRIGVEQKRLDTSFSNVAVAAWVTSLSRIHMHKIFMKIQDDVFYTDTDSLFTTKRFETSDELGDLKLEYEAKRACFLLPKTYLIDEIKGLKDKLGVPINKKVVMKGFDSKKVQHFEPEDFSDFLEGELKLKPHKPIWVEMDAKGLETFKTALRKGKVLMKKEKSTRQIRSTYDKRVIIEKSDGTFDTKPRHISKYIGKKSKSVEVTHQG